ncbi:MAG: DUF4154 domain-containing protein [Candidatus Eisenbacteria bacterium]|nr:DUF4154 domain-containing protein [Candidatus Latescibacterota bacterium]MBD3302079.1 DUF4154 domain-containing protein [Candidatus Eisenbacteria bacterium]
MLLAPRREANAPRAARYRLKVQEFEPVSKPEPKGRRPAADKEGAAWTPAGNDPVACRSGTAERRRAMGSNELVRKRGLGTVAAAICLAAAVCSMILGIGAARASILPVALQVPLLLKVLTYDVRLMAHVDDTIHIGYLYDPRAEAASDRLAGFRNELAARSGQTLRGRRLELVELPLSDSTSVAETLRPHHLEVVYVATGTDDRIGEITAETRRRGIVSVTAEERFVEAGLAVAVVLRGERVGITINLPASLKEGSDWKTSLLQLARVLR